MTETPATPTRRTCPACAHRYAGTVNPDCVVCEGVGVIALGDAALYRSTPEAVARAVELYLESAAREAAQDLPPNDLRGDALALAAQRLRDAGVIGAPIGVPTPTDRTPDPEGPAKRLADWEATRLADQLGQPVRPSDLANVDADQIIYTADDRPRASGLLPNTSAEGWPSFLARAADPTDPLGPSTREHVYARQSRDRAAAVIAGAVDRACEIKAKRSQRKGLALVPVRPLGIA